MLTICRGEPEDYEQASEFMGEAIEDFDKLNHCFYTLRKDIYLLVHKKVHETMNLSRVQFFDEIKNKKINKNFIDDFVNAALVESHLDIIQGETPLDVLLALRFRARKEDWKEIYLRALSGKAAKIRELNQKQKTRKRRYRTWHLRRMSLNSAPTITSIMEEIRRYNKCNQKVLPKASTFEYWDDEVIKNHTLMDDDELYYYY